jgi:hypothetical protein
MIDCEKCPFNKSTIVMHVEQDGTTTAIDVDCFECRTGELIALEESNERLAEKHCETVVRYGEKVKRIAVLEARIDSVRDIASLGVMSILDGGE